MRRFAFLIALTLGASALAAACPAPAPEAGLAAQATWAAEALEPGLVDGPVLALPPDARAVAPLLAPDAPADAEAAEAAFAALARAYGRPLPPRPEGDPFDAEALTAWARAAGAAVAPQAILVMEGPDRRRVAHAAVYWASPLTSRVRIVRLGDEVRGDRDAVLARLGTCAVPVREWLSAPEDVAEAFLTEHVEASMLVLAPGAAPGGEWVPPERLVDALRFRDRATAGLDGFSALFAGERPGIVPVTRLLPTIRGSLGPDDLLRLFRTAR